MQLAQLIRVLNLDSHSSALVSRFSTLDITRVTDKSRDVIPGALFVAYPGVNVDGAQFIPDAIQRGAVAIVTQTPITQSPNLPIFVVENSRAALAHLSAALHNFPSRNLRVIGVTGTDGKTTTSTLIENILLAAGHSVGTITTVGARIGGQEMDTGFHTTTPDAPDIQNYLAQMVEQGTEYAVIESTSHGLAQHRLDAIDFDIAVVTNITHEHLDIHGSWENYRDAKAMLFRALMNSSRKPRTTKVAVLNADDNLRGVFDFLRQVPSDEKIVYSQSSIENRKSKIENETWISARDISHTANGLTFTMDSPFGELQISSPLIGRYNISNILAATGAAIARRIPFDAISQGVKFTRGIVGRMERIENARGLNVIVDFAHTPYALESALKTARELTHGRVIAVFGCAGLRDVQKRAWMGEIAGTHADITIITAEDPRTEPLTQINSQIAAGLHKANRKQDKNYFIIDDRADAIHFAINQIAEPNDVVILCGKGHERSMCFGTTEYAWSDQEAARRALDK
ncbi:MAG: UDP-N-acetylmuramoyl-L-alanyl-D-glutamate--2,6-diaminopimelate ligase [Chloroflexota bacterium]|nr:MAG: UDP-N-acetylmuramoyl-L-alanyl-D-glutamate--2,6-diaminopimelate ligase [Chloroflexota bacterium]